MCTEAIYFPVGSGRCRVMLSVTGLGEPLTAVEERKVHLEFFCIFSFCGKHVFYGIHLYKYIFILCRRDMYLKAEVYYQ